MHLISQVIFLSDGNHTLKLLGFWGFSPMVSLSILFPNSLEIPGLSVLGLKDTFYI